MPAVTMVAAWINALDGVGPSIALASQVPSGSCADLPMAPSSRHKPMAVAVPVSSVAALANTSAYNTLSKWA